MAAAPPSSSAEQKPPELVDSPNYLEFEGQYWYLILKYRRHALRSAFIADTAEALSLPPSCVQALQFAQTQFVVHFIVRHPSALSAVHVKRLLDAYPYTRVWRIYQAMMNLFDGQFSDEVQNVRQADLEAFVQRVYEGEDSPLADMHVSPRAADPRNGEVAALRPADSIVKHPADSLSANMVSLSRQPQRTDVAGAVPLSQRATTHEDSIGFEGDHRGVLERRRHAVEAAVARDVARAVPNAKDVVVRTAVADGVRLSVQYVITLASVADAALVHEALLSYPFPETWKVLLDVPPVLKSAQAAAPHSAMTTRQPPTVNDSAASEVVHARQDQPQFTGAGPDAGTAPPLPLADVTKTAHRLVVVGDDWPSVLAKQPAALRTACTEDAVAATASLSQCVVVATALSTDTRGALVAELTAQHPTRITADRIDGALAAHTLTAVWRVYDAVHAAGASGVLQPPVGWTVTGHKANLDGSAWDAVLEVHSQVIQVAFVDDVSEALGLPGSCIVVNRTEFTGFLVVDYTVQHPSHVTVAMVNRGVDAAPMRRVWRIYADYLKSVGVAARSTTSAAFAGEPSALRATSDAVASDGVRRHSSQAEESRRRSSSTHGGSLIHTVHTVELAGDRWEAVLQAYPESVKDAVEADFCRANDADRSCVSQVALHASASGLCATLDFAHTPAVTAQLTEERLARSDMTDTWRLYAEVLGKLTASAATPRHSRDCTVRGDQTSRRNSSVAKTSRVVTQHALTFDETRLCAQPDSVAAALKRDLDPLLAPLPAHVVDVGVEAALDGVTILYTVSHDSSVPSAEIDRLADEADMEHVWHLADSLAEQDASQDSNADSVAGTPLAPQPPQAPLLPPPLRATEEVEAVLPSSPRLRQRRASSPLPEKTLPRLVAEEEEAETEQPRRPSVSPPSRGAVGTTDVPPPVVRSPNYSRRQSHGSLTSRRASTIGDQRPDTRQSSTDPPVDAPHVCLLSVFFEGSSWARVLAFHAQDFVDCLRADVASALSVSTDDVLSVTGEYADGLVAHYELVCPPGRLSDVNASVDASPMSRMWNLYGRVLAQSNDNLRSAAAAALPSPVASEGHRHARRLSHSAMTSSVADVASRRGSSVVVPDTTGITETCHAVYFDGPAWEHLVSVHENKLRLALLYDITESIGQSPSTLTQLDLEFADGLLVEYAVSHPEAITAAMINERVDDSPMTRTWALYGEYLETLPREQALQPLVASEEVPPFLRAAAEEPPRLVECCVVASTAPRSNSVAPVAPLPQAYVDTREMPHPPRRFMESGRSDRPFHPRSTEGVEVRHYHSDEAPTPNDLRPLEALEELEETDEADASTTADSVDADSGVVEFAMEFDGDAWDYVLDARAPALMDAFMADLVEALEVPASVIRGVDLFVVDGLTINYLLKLPQDVDADSVNHRTDQFSFPRTWALYDQVTDGGSTSHVSSLTEAKPVPDDEPWPDMVRLFEGSMWATVLAGRGDELRELFTDETAAMLRVQHDSLRIVHTSVERDGLYIHFSVDLPSHLDANSAANLVDAFDYPRVTQFYTDAVRVRSRQTSAESRQSDAGSTRSEKSGLLRTSVTTTRADEEVVHSSGDGATADHSPVAPLNQTAEPPPPLTVSSIVDTADPVNLGHVSPVSSTVRREELETSVHTVYVEGFWNSIALHNKAALKEAFGKDVAHAVNIPTSLVTQIEPLAFRHGLLVTYVVLHNADRDLGDIDDLMDADELENMWDLYRQHASEPSSAASPRGARSSSVRDLAVGSPRQRHNSLTTDLVVNPAVTGDIADRYYSMLFEGASWSQVLNRDRAAVRRCFTEDCVNALSAGASFSPRTMTSVQVITEIPLQEGMLVHYLVDHTDPNQREVIDDLVTEYAFPLTWAVFDEFMQQTCASPRNSTWVAARRSRSRATSYAHSPNTGRVYNVIGYAQDSVADEVPSAEIGNASATTQAPSRASNTSAAPPSPLGRGTLTQRAPSHRSLTSFRVQRDAPRLSLVSGESFISLHDSGSGKRSPEMPPPVQEVDTTAGAHQPPTPQRQMQEAMRHFAFPEGSPNASPNASPRDGDKKHGEQVDTPTESKAHSPTDEGVAHLSSSPDEPLPPIIMHSREDRLPSLHTCVPSAPAARPLRASEIVQTHTASAHAPREANHRKPTPPPLRRSELEPAIAASVPEHSRVPDFPPSSTDSESTGNRGGAQPAAVPAEPIWLYAFELEPPHTPTLQWSDVLTAPIEWVASPVGDAPTGEQPNNEDSIIELPVSPPAHGGDDPYVPPAAAMYDQFFQPPAHPTQQRRIVVLDHAMPTRAVPPSSSSPFIDGTVGLPPSNDGNVIVVIQRTTLDVNGLLDKLGQLEDFVRARHDTLRDLFETI